MNQYETVFILTPVLSEDQMKEAVKKFTSFLTDNGGNIVHEDHWGLRKLAYPIQKKSTGFYHLVEYQGPGELVNRLEVEFRRDERIIRFLSVKLDKFAVEYAEKRRKQAANAELTKENKEE